MKLKELFIEWLTESPLHPALRGRAKRTAGREERPDKAAAKWTLGY